MYNRIVKNSTLTLCNCQRNIAEPTLRLRSITLILVIYSGKTEVPLFKAQTIHATVSNISHNHNEKSEDVTGVGIYSQYNTRDIAQWHGRYIKLFTICIVGRISNVRHCADPFYQAF